MKASETRLIRIIEGTNQYLVPHFQRPYTWLKKNWDALWADLDALTEPDEPSAPRSAPLDHFMGAIVTAPAHSVPEGVTKYLLIDGQQRLTTLLLLLACIRDRARQLQDEKLAARIQDLYLTNRYQEGTDQYKLLPTQGDEPAHNDRSVFIAVIDGQPLPSQTNNLAAAFTHFSRLVRTHSSERLTALAAAILSHVFLVSIVLEREDNPYSIFESLNAKGQPLSQSDLVRNFFFMSISASRHETLYNDKWTPMEKRVGRENMELFIRHFLMREGSMVKEPDVYYTLKKTVEGGGRDCAEEVLDDLVRTSFDYVRLLAPDEEPDVAIRERLHRLQRLRATVCYPFLLRVFADQRAGRLAAREVVTILDAIESFIVRRYVCGTIRAELNELFVSLYRSASRFTKLAEGVRDVLGSRNFPLDAEFESAFQTRRLYGAGEVRDRAKLILERLEASWPTKERVAVTALTIEHIMPQSLTDWWKSHLGSQFEETHELYLHTIGNLTLTGYNAELSNADFTKKRELLQQSRLALNLEVASNESWTRQNIEARAALLAARALQVWPNFAPEATSRRALVVRGTTPRKLVVLGQVHDVQSWQDVLRITLTQILELGEDVLDQVVAEFPRYVSRSPEAMRHPRHLSNGTHYESHLNAEQIHRICTLIAQQAGLSADEWRVEAA